MNWLSETYRIVEISDSKDTPGALYTFWQGRRDGQVSLHNFRSKVGKRFCLLRVWSAGETTNGIFLRMPEKQPRDRAPCVRLLAGSHQLRYKNS
jgi:hypothetical protein